MKISEFIDELDINSLANLVDEFSLQIAPVTKNKIKKYFDTAKDFHEIILNSYDDLERKRLFEFYVEAYEHQFIDMDFQENEVNENSFTVSDLIANLWGYVVKEQGTEKFIFFEDAFKVLDDNFVNKIVIEEEVEENTTLGNQLISNVDSFIEVVSSDKYKYIKIGVSKKIVKDVLAKTTIKEDVEVEFVFSFLDNINVIHKSGTGNIVVSEENMHWWLTNTAENKIKIIDKFIKGSFVSQKFPEFESKDVVFFKFMLSLCGKKISKEHVLSLNIIDAEKFNLAIETMVAIGLIKSDETSIVYNLKVNSVGEENVDNFMYVQPNYEITTSFLLPIEKKIFILKFSELKSKDSAVVYQITKSSITKGFHYGLSADEIINFLNENSISPVPQNIEFSVRDWFKIFSSISFEKVNLLTIKDDFLLKKVMSNARFTDLLVREIDQHHIIVSDFDKAKEILISEEVLLEDVKIMLNDEDIKEDVEADISFRKKENEDIYIPRNIKKFINTNRLYTATSEQKILAIKYCLTKELRIEVLYDDITDKVLNNKKIELQPIEISDMWENPDVVVYSPEHKKNYNISVKNIKRFRILYETL